MRIVTGHTGEPHITSNDQMGLHQGILGTGNYVLNVGEKFAATLTNANTVSILDGEGVMQGVHFRVLPGTVDTVVIDNGTTGYNRIDLICARYTKTEGTGIESVEWAVVKGTPTASTPAEPEYNEGDILAGDLVADFPMFKVTITGVNPVLTTLFSSGSLPEEIEGIDNRLSTVETRLANPITVSMTDVEVIPGQTAVMTLNSVPAGKYLMVVYGQATVGSGYSLHFRAYTDTPNIQGCYGGFGQAGPTYSHTSFIQINSTMNIEIKFQNTESNPDAAATHSWMTACLFRMG